MSKSCPDEVLIIAALIEIVTVLDVGAKHINDAEAIVMLPSNGALSGV